ncbi:MAG TPA: TlpA family protein disulfide reductase [Acidiferrobacteraceae bacterium]|nr:TlpA family protein disulfide reductase [Acidiferrobacteraceae bacterium]
MALSPYLNSMRLYWAKLIIALTLVGLSVSMGWASSVQVVDINLPSGEEVPVTRYAAKGERVILWLPSEFGLQPQHQALALALQGLGVETWLADLHTAYFEPHGRNSVKVFQSQDIAKLIEQVIGETRRKVFVVSSQGGARAVLNGARAWQLAHPGDKTLGGLILFHPVLYAQRPVLGQDAQYLPVVRATNLPVHIIQPSVSTSALRVPVLMAALAKGGAQVSITRLKGVESGYHVRADDQVGTADLKARRALPSLMIDIMGRLSTLSLPTQAAALLSPVPLSSKAKIGLAKYRTATSTASLALEDLSGKLHALKDYRGQVVLLSFWASWCPPCVKEMPSQNRLQHRFYNKSLRILGVNVGEDAGTVNKFLSKVDVNFTILLDEDQRAYKDWKVYVVPTNFLIDKQGRIRYGSVGAADWDDPDVINIVARLLGETAPPIH